MVCVEESSFGKILLHKRKPRLAMSPIMESSDFTIRRKDFPALPGNVSTSDSSSESSWSDESSSEVTEQSDTALDNDTPTREINTSAEGRVSNIPSSMINDQFGMVGLLSFIRGADAEPSLRALTLGEDLTALGLNLKSSENLYSNFEGPWAGITTCSVPYVPYKFTAGVRQRLASVFISKYDDDLLFYLFYTSPRDALQMVAAAELYKRGWRYHTKQRVWICSLSGGVKVEESIKFSLSPYYVFDVMSWKRVIKSCFLDSGKIEGQPVVPELSLL